MDRVILHCDLNCFYASVELRSHPELQNRPHGRLRDPTSRHGIILAKNEPAKNTVSRQRKPSGRPRKNAPIWYCCRLTTTCTDSTPKRSTPSTIPIRTWWSPSASMRAGWISPTPSTSWAEMPGAVANQLRERIKRELGLTLSVGVCFNKVFAKLGSDYQKPDATTVISRENWRQLLWPLPVGGHAVRRRRRPEASPPIRCGHFGPVGRLQADDALETLMGKMGPQLQAYANGQDQDPVRSRYEAEPVKSVGNGTTFPQNLTKPRAGPDRNCHALRLCGHPPAACGAVRRRRSGDGP